MTTSTPSRRRLAWQSALLMELVSGTLTAKTLLLIALPRALLTSVVNA